MSGVESGQGIESTVKQSRASGIATRSGVWSGGFLFITGEGELMITEGSGQIYDPTGSRKVGHLLRWPNIIVDLEEELEENPDITLHVALRLSGTSAIAIVREVGWSTDERREMIYLGTVSALEGKLRFVSNKQSHVRTTATQLDALMDDLGTFVTSGLRFRPRSKLAFCLTPGTAFQRSARYQDELEPNRVQWVDGLRAPFVTYVHRDGDGGWVGETFTEPEIRPHLWDDGSGELKTVPENRYTLQTVYLDPASGLVVIQYGQELLANRDKVANALVFAEWDPYKQPDMVRRAIIAVKGGAVTLQDKKKCIVTHCNRFGGLGGE